MTMAYLNYLSDQSNVVCNNQEKKTITPQHVFEALEKMKMKTYLNEMFELKLGENEEFQFSEKQKKEMISQKFVSGAVSKKKKSKKFDNSHGMTQAELQELQ
mmetsp:Transcript_17187/g.16412  ORF Transcript_17187/g.16412 Transcript_17187/m.16412 type:complete len:102 (+) Transcript_17187:156-461(+)